MMDKSCHSSGEESSAINPNNNNNNNTNNNNNQYLKNLHKLSHKISKPPIRKPFEFDHHQSPVILEQSQPSNLHHNQQQHQPPVYNVSKSDFRDVVQKLTGSPAHERVNSNNSNNPVQQHPVQVQPAVKPQSSRLQRIRPPPLEHVGNRPPPNSSAVITAVNLTTNPGFRPGFSGNFYQRPLSPLPPLPAVHATAESPISAYMRCFQTNSNSISGPSPRWNSFSPPPPSLPPPPPPPPQQQQLQPPPAVTDYPAPSSPLPFGCLNSPKSQFPMLSPGFPFSPTNQFGFQQLTPLSPTPPAPSPRWKSL